jgi:hypothetical protein
MEQYKIMFVQKPNEFTSPLEKADHPEIDTSEVLYQAGIKVYQFMIEYLEGAISLGSFDIQMSRFRTAPKKCHFERLRVCIDI